MEIFEGDASDYSFPAPARYISTDYDGSSIASYNHDAFLAVAENPRVPGQFYVLVADVYLHIWPGARKYDVELLSVGNLRSSSDRLHAEEIADTGVEDSFAIDGKTGIMQERGLAVNPRTGAVFAAFSDDEDDFIFDEYVDEWDGTVRTNLHVMDPSTTDFHIGTLDLLGVLEFGFYPDGVMCQLPTDSRFRLLSAPQFAPRTPLHVVCPTGKPMRFPASVLGDSRLPGALGQMKMGTCRSATPLLRSVVCGIRPWV